jgi:catechol 2,3-dioxygenase-like lactoylglutathione lyase family enzyme
LISFSTKPQEADMSNAEVQDRVVLESPGSRTVDMRFELVVLPVSDVDRAKRFYAGLGWKLDMDFVRGDDFRVIQFTPPGSPGSVIFGRGISSTKPGSSQDLYLVVSDIVAARSALLARGVVVSELFHDAGGVFHHADGEGRVDGPAPKRRSYGTYAAFNDPDGNGWLMQEVTARLPGHGSTGDTTFSSSIELAGALRRALAAYETREKKRPGEKDEDWPSWYAEYIVDEQAGKPLPA